MMDSRLFKFVIYSALSLATGFYALYAIADEAKRYEPRYELHTVAGKTVIVEVRDLIKWDGKLYVIDGYRSDGSAIINTTSYYEVPK